MGGEKAIFLDRDDTIIRDERYLRDPSKVTLLPHAVEGLNRLERLGYLLFIVSNQSGVARGLMSEQDVLNVNTRVVELLSCAGVSVRDVAYCPHLETGSIVEYAKACTCRKPNPGMIHTLAGKHRIHLAASIMVGDKESDVLAGLTAGCQTVLLADSPVASSADIVLPNLLALAQWVEGGMRNEGWQT